MKRERNKAFSLFAICLIVVLSHACESNKESYSFEVNYSDIDSSRTITIDHNKEQIRLGLTENGKPEFIGIYQKDDTGYFWGFDGDVNLVIRSENLNGERHGKEQVLRDGFVIEEHEWIEGAWVSTEIYNYDFDDLKDYRQKLYKSQVLILERSRDSIVYIDSTYFPDPEYDFSDYQE
jgi:hypothetical protein